MNVRRLLPLGGVIFVVLALVAVIGIGGDTPGTDDSAQEVFSFYDAHTVRQGVGAFVLAASVPFLIFFATSLATGGWWTPEARRSVWRYVLIAGAALTGAAFLMVAMVHFALADGADNNVAPEGLQALNVLDNDFWVAFNPALGVMMLGAAGCLLGRTSSPRWLGWVALVLGIALFIPFADFFALLISLLWIIVVSILLFRQGTPGEEASALASPAA